MNRNLQVKQEYFTWKNSDILPCVKDQGCCGASWAFTTTTTIEANNKLKYNKTLLELSEQELLDCATDCGCWRGSIEDGFLYARARAGLANDTLYSY